MPVCPKCNAVPGEKHTYDNAGKLCPGYGRMNPATKDDQAAITVSLEA